MSLAFIRKIIHKRVRVTEKCARFWSQDFKFKLYVKWHTSYDETSMTKKLQVEVAISYNDMEGQSSLSHQLKSFKALL